MKIFYSLKRKVLAVCLFGMILMALCVGGISLWTISHLTYDYEIQNMNHVVDTKSVRIDDELLRSENIVNYAANSLKRELKDPAQLRDAAFRQQMATLVANDFEDARSDMAMITSYYLYFPEENISPLWMAAEGKDHTFYDAIARQKANKEDIVPRHILSFAYMMDTGEAAWTGPYYSPTVGRYVISYMSPVYEGNAMVAIVGVDMDFVEFMNNLYTDSSDGTRSLMMLSDATGTLQYSLDNPLGAKLEKKGICIKNSVEEVKHAGTTDEAMLSYTWDGENSIAGVKTLRNGMNFIDLKQIRQVYSRTHQAFAQIGVGTVVICLMVSILPIYMIGRLSERLQNVIEAAQNVGAGNYDVHLHDKNPDDIGELSRNFQSMVGKVAASQERLENMSLHDALTGALNRMGLDDAIGKWLRENPQGKGALVSLDLDGFKFINDLYSHMAGDEALRTLTQDLRESFGSQHIIGRNGGDEFIVFMTDTTPELAQQTIDAFSRKIKMFNFDGETHVFSVSIGYTLYQGDNTPLSKLFHQADTALYAVKLKGRNHYRIYKETMENISRSSLGFNLDNITRNLPTALFVCEAKEHGQILFVNKAMLDLFECHNTGDFMSYTQEKEENIVCPCDRERVSKLIWQQTAADPEATRCLVYRIRTLKGNIKQVYSVWRQADNPNYGKVFYASIVDYQIIKGHIPEIDEHPTC